jgi:DNA-directed DNA polymerase III PolC
MKPSFVHLHCHSNYSLLSGAMSIDELLDEACRLDMPSIALTDNNGLYGAIPFYKKALERGIRPLLGTVLDEPGGSETAVIIAKNNDGFSRLCRLITDRHLEENFHLKDALNGLGPEVFILTASADLLYSLAKTRPPGTTYAEVSDMRDPASSSCMAHIRRICEETGLPAAATNNVHFMRPSDHDRHRVLTAIKKRKTLTDLLDEECVPAEAWLKPAGQMECLFRSWPSAVRNTRQIAEVCDVKFDLNKPRLPTFPLPLGETPFSYLWRLCFKGATRRFKPLCPEVVDRLTAELKVIYSLGFAPYFLLVWDIVRFAKRRRIPLIGRGSAANSIVSYVLGITDIDPLRHNLFFERFLNPERSSPPDIDVDFCWKRRDMVLDYVYKKYGADRVAMISTHVTMGARSAVREVGRVMGIPPGELSAFTAGMPYSRKLDLEYMRENFPRFRALPVEREPYRTVLELAGQLIGYPRHLSIHPGGIVVSPFPLLDLIPLERSKKGLVVTQYDMFPIEDLGLTKIDLLSQRSLAVLADTLEMLEKKGKPVPDMEDRDKIQSDGPTRKLIREGRTMGCFYIESPAMRSLLRKLKVDDFEMLTAASSVIRPGVAESGMMQQFIECHNGLREPSYPHPRMRELLGDTYGVMIYQEDVIKVAHAIAGMSLGEADLLRRAMSGKMRSRKAMKHLRDRFIDGALKGGASIDVASEIWRQIESFAGYAFCKAHSASYALLSFKVAYLKAHHPAEFLAAVLSNRGGFYHHTVYMEEARRLGIHILPPDINRSHADFTAEQGRIRTGLIQIRGLSARTLKIVEEERKAGGVFRDLRDFRDRTVTYFSDIERLVRAGAFASLGKTRPELLWRLYLMEKGELVEETALTVPDLPEYPREQQLKLEVETMGYSISQHPLQTFRNLYTDMKLIEAIDLKTMDGKKVKLLGWLIASKRINTRSGAFMQFLSLEDLTDTFEVVLFPATYQQYGSVLKDRGPYIVTGRVMEESGCYTVNAERVQRIKKNTGGGVTPRGKYP